jgi:DNA-binding CsgD family transcriptional regulator
MATQAMRSKKTLLAERGMGTLEDLLRALISHAPGFDVEGCADPRDDDPPAEELILDMELDGSRYLLMRLPREERLRVQLSPREQEIVRMVADGHPTKVIAGVLSISSWTVCTHLRRIFAKFGVGSRAAMVARMMDNGGRSPKMSAPVVARTGGLPPGPTTGRAQWRRPAAQQ